MQSQHSRRPERFSAGSDLAVETYHVEQEGKAFTFCRTVGLHRWYPLTRKDNPAWRTWPTQADKRSGKSASTRACGGTTPSGNWRAGNSSRPQY